MFRTHKSIPSYKINTLTYAFCFWQFFVQVQVVAYIGCLISEFTKGNIFVVELGVKYFATVHLFIMKINSVLEEIIR